VFAFKNLASVLSLSLSQNQKKLAFHFSSFWIVEVTRAAKKSDVRQLLQSAGFSSATLANTHIGADIRYCKKEERGRASFHSAVICEILGKSIKCQ